MKREQPNMKCNVWLRKMLHSRAYFREALLTALRQEILVESSAAYAMDLLQLSRMMWRSGNAPFKDVQQLYRDKIHLTKGGGRYLAHNAMRQALGQPYSSKGFEGKFTPSVKDYLDSLLASLPSVEVPNPTYDLDSCLRSHQCRYHCSCTSS